MATTMLEREIKLQFTSADDARAAVAAAGCTPLLGRRLQEDALLDTEDNCSGDAGVCCVFASRMARAVSPSKAPCSRRP
jgi:hypothetical protein